MNREELLKLICDNTGKRINLPNFTIEELEDFANAIMSRQADRIAALEASVADNQKDAERYRWMRGSSNQWGDDWQHLVGVFLDAEVDAALLVDTSTQEVG